MIMNVVNGSLTIMMSFINIMMMMMMMIISSSSSSIIRTFFAALVGFVRTVRDGHPETPLVCIYNICTYMCIYIYTYTYMHTHM